MATIYVRGTRAEVKRIIGNMAAIHGDPVLMRGIQVRVGMTALSLIQQNMVDKARGGGGADNEPWAPLAPATLEHRRRKAGLPTRRQIHDRIDKAAERMNDADTDEEFLKRQKKYDRQIEILHQIDEPVEILRDEGIMFNSLSPGTDADTTINTDQVFETPPGAVIVGTRDFKAPFHQHGTSRMPQRRLWPEPENWPESWWQQLGNAARTGYLRAISLALTGSGMP